MSHFAIVTPNLNQSRFLPDAFESLRHQSVAFDLAVMDGGSVDDFEQVVQKYRDMITFVQSGPDGGQAIAIAGGIEKIKGDIVSWLNADDYYFPGALDKVAAVFENHPEIDVVYGDAVHVKPDGAFMSYFHAIEEFNPGILPFSCFICQPACFVRRSAYQAVGGINSAFKYAMDWDLWCRLAADGARFKYVREVLAAVRYYPGTKTLSGDKQRYYEIWRIGKKYGKRSLPVSWLGFYRFDLSFKKEKTFWERVIFSSLEWMRYLKKRLFKQTQGTLYGFYRWQSRVDGRCLIQFPCYGKGRPEYLCLSVSPPESVYRAIVDTVVLDELHPVDGKLRIKLPPGSSPCHRIQLECRDRRQWEITDCSF